MSNPIYLAMIVTLASNANDTQSPPPQTYSQKSPDTRDKKQPQKIKMPKQRNGKNRGSRYPGR